MNIMELSKGYAEKMTADRHWLHQNPELGLDLPKTAEYVRNRLVEMGYEPYDVGQNGLVVDIIGGNKDGKTILLRADMDALPIKENSGVDFSSTNDYMHACGHDMHTASLLGAAEILKDVKGDLNGNVKLVFQPAEETFEGAANMIADGLFTKGLKADFAYASHVVPVMPTGLVGTVHGVFMASSDNFKITIRGKSGHGSTPELSVDSINIGVHIYLAFQEIMAREIGISEQAVLTFGAFQGGEAANVFPEYTVLRGTLRTFSEDIRQRILKRMPEIVESVAKTYRGEAELEFVARTPVNENDAAMADKVINGLQGFEGMHAMIIDMKPAAGSEDFAYFAQQMPSVFSVFGAQIPGDENPSAAHHESVRFNDDALPVAAAAYVGAAFAVLKD